MIDLRDIGMAGERDLSKGLPPAERTILVGQQIPPHDEFHVPDVPTGGGTPGVPGTPLLLEDGSFLLLETGDKLLVD